MSFVRVFIGLKSNAVRHVIERDIPFPGDGSADLVRESGDGAEELEVRDLGWMEPGDFRTLDGKPTTPSHHVFLRLEKPELHAEIPRIHDCPCTMDGIRDRVRAKGPLSIPAKPRAWLANVLHPKHVTAMNLHKGLNIAAFKAAEALRNKRDPDGGSIMALLEREAQRLSDVRAAAQLARRKAAEEPPSLPAAIAKGVEVRQSAATGSPLDRDAILAMVAQALEQKGGWGGPALL